MNHDQNAPLLETGPIANAVLVGVVLFVAMPIWAAVKWLLKH